MTTTPALTPKATRTRRLLAAAVGLLVALTAFGLGGSPAGAVPGNPNILGTQGYDQPGPSGYHRLTWARSAYLDGGPITAWQIERWDVEHTQKLATYNRSAASGPVLTVPGLPDEVPFGYRVRAKNDEGFGPWSGWEAIRVHTNLNHWHPYPSEADFVRGQYQDLLGRQPSIGELSTATIQITNAATAATFMNGLATRTDRVAVRHPVIRLYLAYFDRAPDPSGMAYWEGQLESGAKTLKGISAFFAKSNEFKTTYGNLSNAQFVELIYQNVLDRSAAGDPGAAFWTNELNQGKRTRGDVMVGFSESAEGKALRRGDATASDLWLAMLDEAISDANMGAYGLLVLTPSARPGDLASVLTNLNDYNP